MALRDLLFNIRADDQTAAAFKSVKGNLRGVEGAAATASEKIGRIGASMAKLGAVGSVGSAGLLAIFRDSVAVYDTQARAEAKVAQAIETTGGAAGFTADQLKAQASAMQSLSRFGDEEILDGVIAQLLTFTNISGNAFSQASTLALDLSTHLNQDLKSSAILLGKALNDPVKGLSALTRAGVQFSEDQADVIKSLAATGQMAEAQAIILNELQVQFGGQAAKAAKAGVGSLQQVSMAWGDLKEEVGSVVATALPPLVSGLESVVDWLQDATPETKKFAVGLGALLVVLPPVVASLGLLFAAIGVIGAPVAAAVAGLSALGVAIAAFSNSSSDLKDATANLSASLADEIAASQTLAGLMDGNAQLSVAAARQKLAEAKSRHENVKAIIAEQRALALASDEYGNLSGRIDGLRSQLGSIAPDSFYDKLGPVQREAYDEAEAALARLLNKRAALLATDEASAEQLARTEANIASLEGALADARGGTVTFGDSVIEPIELADGLAASVGNVGKAAEGTVPKVEDLAQAMKNAEWESTKAELTGLVRSAESVGDAFDQMKDRIIDRVLAASLDPAWNALGDALSGALSGGASGGSGSGGLLSKFGGSLLSGLGSAVGLPGFDRGGAFTVTGRAGVDRNNVTVPLSRGEDVEITRRGQAPSGATVNVYIQTPNPSAFQASRAQIGAQLSRAVGAAMRGA